jgi:hypothetical protein
MPGLNIAASQDPSPSKAYLVLKAPKQSDCMPGLIPGRGVKQNGLTGGEILPAHDYCNEGKR